MDDEYEEYPDSPRFADEAKVLERVGFARLVPDTVIEEGPLHELHKKLQRATLTPEDNFRISLETQFLRLRNENIIYISEEDQKNIVDALDNTKNLADKHPLGFIFGYIVSQGGHEISQAKFDSITKKILPKLHLDKEAKTSETKSQDIRTYEGLAPPDIIRYGRYWILHLSGK